MQKLDETGHIEPLFSDIENNEPTDPYQQPQVHIKIAFQWAFYYLKNETLYLDAMRDILSKGGDTNVNAAVVGGMLGAAQGFEALPI